MAKPTLDISGMTRKEINALPDSDLIPILRAGFEVFFNRPMSDQNLEENLAAVRQDHWAPGIPTALGGGAYEGKTIGKTIGM
jgi:hypothetical protein